MHYIPVVRVCLIREGSQKTDSNVVRGPADIARLGRLLIGESDREHLVALFLDTKSKVIGMTTVSIGTLNCSLCHPREIFKAAILASAAGIILVHNHPSGNPEASDEDKAVTRRIKQVGELLDIELIDHVIIGDGKYVSLKESGVV